MDDSGGGDVTPTKFVAHGQPLLAEGNTMDLLARAPGLWAHLKVYADGGENALHAHGAEDHLFFVLDGSATFTDGNGIETVVGRYEGMVVPRDALYMFRCSGEGNLVMIRIGAPADPAHTAWVTHEASGVDYPEAMMIRVDREHRAAPGDDPANGTGSVRGVPIPDRTFS